MESGASRIHRVYGKVVLISILISIPPSFLQTCFIVFVAFSSLYLKHPNKSFFFNPIKYLDIFYTHTVYSINIFHLNVKLFLDREKPVTNFTLLNPVKSNLVRLKPKVQHPKTLEPVFKMNFLVKVVY